MLKPLIYTGIISGGYILYRKTLHQFVFNTKNIFVSYPEYEALRDNKTIKQQNNQKIYSHPLNDQYSSNKKRIVVVGTGIIGQCTAYILAKEHTDKQIILVQNLNQENNDQQQQQFSLSQQIPLLTLNDLKQNFINLISRQIMSVMIQPSLLFTINFYEWAFNFFKLSSNPNQIKNNLHSLQKLGLMSKTGMEDYIKQNGEQDLSNQKAIILFGNSEQANTYIQITKELGIKDIEVIKENDNLEQILQSSDFSINVKEFGGKLIEEGILKYGLIVCENTQLKQFGFMMSSNMLVGLQTNHGFLLSDKIVLTQQNTIKDIYSLLGIKIPLITYRNYQLDIQPATPKILLHQNICDIQNKIFISQINQQQYRVFGGIQLINKTQKKVENNQKYVDYLINYSEKYIGDINKDQIQIKQNYIEITPDDLPIIGQVQEFNNILVNCGHSNKSLANSLASAKVISQIFSGKQSQLDKIDTDQYSAQRFYARNW